MTHVCWVAHFHFLFTVPDLTQGNPFCQITQQQNLFREISYFWVEEGKRRPWEPGTVCFLLVWFFHFFLSWSWPEGSPRYGLWRLLFFSSFFSCCFVCLKRHTIHAELHDDSPEAAKAPRKIPSFLPED